MFFNYIFVIITLSFGILTAIELVLKPNAEEQTKLLNSSTVVTCELTGMEEAGQQLVDEARLIWYSEDGREIDSSSKTIYSEYEPETLSNKLYISNIASENQGEYKCSVELKGERYSKAFKLVVQEYIKFHNLNERQYPREHSDALIICNITSKPVAQVSWKFKGHKLSIDDPANVKYQRHKHGMLIKNISSLDNGPYACQAEVDSIGWFETKTIQVEVHVPPKISEGPGITDGIEGEEASIACKGNGFPSPTFNFFKGDEAEPIKTGHRLVVDSNMGTLSFKPLNKSDEGTYRCLAMNDVGNETISGSLKVLIKPTIIEFKNQSNRDGQPLSMDCKTIADPAANITFSKAGEAGTLAMGDDGDGRITVFSNGKGIMRLSITSLLPTDTGDYICHAASKIGINEKSAHLLVYFAPKFDENQTRTEYIWANKTRNITCGANGQPVPTFIWSRNKQQITDNSTYKLYQAEKSSILEVTVREADQSWIYGGLECQAENDYGTIDTTIELKRATVPDAPHLIEIADKLPNGFVLNITPPEEDGGQPIIGYQIEYTEKSNAYSEKASQENGSLVNDDQIFESNYVDIQLKPDETVYTLENLKPNTEYTLKIKAKNEVGTGRPKEITSKTEPIRQPYQLKINSGTTADAFKYEIIWDKPNTGGLPIKEFEFKFREETMVDDKKAYSEWTNIFRQNLGAEPIRSFVLEELSPNTTYQIQVRAKNDIDWSEYSQPLNFHTKEASARDYAQRLQTQLSTGSISGIVLVLLLLVLIVIDVTCFFVMGCGVTKFVVTKLCEKSKIAEKEKAMEEGEKVQLQTNETEEGYDDDIKKPAIIYETVNEEPYDEMKKPVV